MRLLTKRKRKKRALAELRARCRELEVQSDELLNRPRPWELLSAEAQEHFGFNTPLSGDDTVTRPIPGPVLSDAERDKLDKRANIEGVSRGELQKRFVLYGLRNMPLGWPEVTNTQEGTDHD